MKTRKALVGKKKFEILSVEHALIMRFQQQQEGNFG